MIPLGARASWRSRNHTGWKHVQKHGSVNVKTNIRDRACFSQYTVHSRAQVGTLFASQGMSIIKD
jgi:hypothetical protein